MQCKLTTSAPVESVPTWLFEVPSLKTYSDSFIINILAKFRNDEVGQIFRTDSNILLIGSMIYWKLHCKQDKSVEVCRLVRGGVLLIFIDYLGKMFSQQKGTHLTCSRERTSTV